MIEENAPGNMPAEDQAKPTVRVLIMGKKDKVQELLYQEHLLDTRNASLPADIRENIMHGIKTYQFYGRKTPLTLGTLNQVGHITEILNRMAAQRFAAFEEDFADAEPVPFVFTDYIEGNSLKASKIPEKVLEARGYPEDTKNVLRQLFVVTYPFAYSPDMVTAATFPNG